MDALSSNKAYFVATLAFVLPMGLSGVTFLLKAPTSLESVLALGFPEYIIAPMGLAKLLGVLALLSGRWPTLKEWAYAGFTFDLLGASYAGLAMGQGAKSLAPLSMLAVMLLSYVLWKRRAYAAQTAASTPQRRPEKEARGEG